MYQGVAMLAAMLAEEMHNGHFQKHEKTWGTPENLVLRSFGYRIYERRQDRVKYALHAAVQSNKVNWMKLTLSE